MIPELKQLYTEESTHTYDNTHMQELNQIIIDNQTAMPPEQKNITVDEYIINEH